MPNRPADDTERKFTQIYRMPGEGLIAEFRTGNSTILYDPDGLRYLIMDRRHKGLDTSQEDRALAVLLSLDSG